MASVGQFILGFPTSFSTGGGGGTAGATLVEVPGNAAEIVARSAGSGLTITEVGADSVEVVFPAEATANEMQDLAISLLQIFGAAAEPNIGWFTVTAKGMIGMADSSDAGSRPDYIPVLGTVTFFPNFALPIKIVSTNTFFSVGASQAVFDSDGELSFDGEKTIRLISPAWDDLSANDWQWVAQVRPGPGQNWQGWDASFTAAPGDTVDLSDFLP